MAQKGSLLAIRATTHSACQAAKRPPIVKPKVSRVTSGYGGIVIQSSQVRLSRKISEPLPPEFYKPLSSHQALAEIPATSHLGNYICCSALWMQSHLSLSLWLRGGSNNEIIRSGEISRSKHRNQLEASFDLSTRLHITKWETDWTRASSDIEISGPEKKITFGGTAQNKLIKRLQNCPM